MSATIEIQFRDGRTEQRPMTEGTWVIGRETGDVVLDDPRVSGLHGELTLKGPLLTFTDRDSSNGSFDGDGNRLSGVAVLQQGSVVRMGDSRITVAQLRHQNPLKGRTMVMGSVAMPGAAANTPSPTATASPATAPPAAASPATAPPAPTPTGSPPAGDTEPAAAPDSAAAFAATVAQPGQAMQGMAQAAAADASAAAGGGPSAGAGAGGSGDLGADVTGTPESRPVSGSGPANVWELDADAPDTDQGAAAAATPAGPESGDPTQAATGGAATGGAAAYGAIGGGSSTAVAADPARPFGVPIASRAGAGSGVDFIDELKSRLSYIFRLYEPHIVPMAKLVAIVAVPLALLNFMLSFVPLLGWLVQLVIAPLGTAAMYVWAVGATNLYADRVLRGEAADFSGVARAHSNVLGEWAVSALVAAAPSIASLLLVLTIVLAPLTLLLIVPSIMLTWAVGPAFMTENRRGADAALRSYRLFKADWKHILTVFAMLIIGLIPVVIASMILGAIPFIGHFASAAVQLVVMPFSALFSYALFHETIARIRNAGLHVD